MKVIPAIDIHEGKVVRLTEGKFDTSVVYGDSPIKVAESLHNAGFTRLHIVDLSGAKTGKPVATGIIKEIKTAFPIEVQTGGGIRSVEDAGEFINAGADQIIAGSISVKNRVEFERIVARFGGNRIISASDVRDGMIATDGWQGTSAVAVEDHIRYCLGLGIGTFLVTDISLDGTLKGVNTALYHRLQIEFPGAKFIASGGVKGVEDLAILQQLDVWSVVIGKAWYEGKITLKEMIEYAG